MRRLCVLARYAAASVILAAVAEGGPVRPVPSRADYGELIVLHLSGSYEEMGRQQVDLLGETARSTYLLQRADWDRLIAPMGASAHVLDALLPRFWSWLGPRYERSGFYAEINGMASGLQVSGADAVRGVYGFLGGGSTVFAASRTATADGSSLLGKNSDWGDGSGRRRPIVVYYHPTNGDLAHIIAGTPGPGVPGLGLNEAGLALASTFFNSDEIVGVPLPQWPQRRALQRARTVSEGLQIFLETRTLGLSTFMVLADADGDLATIECTPYNCAVYRPSGDFLVQTNHARTAEMVAHDRGRVSDSFLRYAAAHAALRRHLGLLTPAMGVEILRDRSNSRYANDSVVANPTVLNSAVVHPASRTLWHSTTLQPLAPFGEFVPFSLAGSEEAPAPAIPSDRRLGTPEMEHERAAIAELRRALALFDEGRIEESGRVLDALVAAGEPSLHPQRLAWARARVRWTLGRLQEADELLAGLDAPETPFDVRAHGLVVRALIADQGRHREEALRLYGTAQAFLDANPDYTGTSSLAPLRAWIDSGISSPQLSPRIPATPNLQSVPR